MPGPFRCEHCQRRNFESLRHRQGPPLMIRLTSIFVLFATILAAPAAQKSKAPDMENSIVQMEVSRRQYDFVQPWTRRVDQMQKMGTVVGPHEILTTAEYLADVTLLRLQKGGRGKWYIGENE